MPREEFLLSRCVKCNSLNIDVISLSDAEKYLDFKHPEDMATHEYWQCKDCKQVYWEGETFQRSKQRFKNLSEKALNTIQEESK